mgnify:CR=1 FL=1
MSTLTPSSYVITHVEAIRLLPDATWFSTPEGRVCLPIGSDQVRLLDGTRTVRSQALATFLYFDAPGVVVRCAQAGNLWLVALNRASAGAVPRPHIGAARSTDRSADLLRISAS